MFNKEKFAEIIKKISETYESQREFSSLSEINRTYLSQYMNMKLDDPPKPKILKKLASSSKGLISYEELMQICGYLNGNSDDEVFYLYNEMNVILEEKHKNIEKLNLNEEEKEIVSSLTQQLLDTGVFKGIAPMQFNYENVINDINFISNNSKNKIEKALHFEYSYLYNFVTLKRKIGNLRHNTTINTLDKKSIQTLPKTKFHMCPVYGKISAGIPNWAEECLEGYLPIDPNLFGIVNPDECFFLLVNGQSMNKVIRNGAYALIRKQDIVENGEICAVLVNGYEATLKKFSKQGDLVILEPMSDDPSFTTQVYNKETQIRIIGKYIGKFEMNK